MRHRLARRPLAPVSAPRARLRHRWLYPALAGFALAGSMVMPALPAAADTGNITFGTVSGDGSGNMTVTVTSDDPLGSIRVHLMSGSTDTGVDPADFTEQGAFSPGAAQTWTLSAPVTDLAALPPGTYTATADATDLDGDQQVAAQPLTGSFTVDGQPSVTIGPATVPTTTPGEGFTLSGQVNIQDSLTGTTAGFGGQPVTISQVGSTNQWSTTTASNGSYTANVTGNPADQYVASVAATSFSPKVSSTTTAEDVAQYAPTTLTASAVQAPYGQQSITGTLTYQSAPFASTGAPSGVTITATSPGQKNITTTTGAGGAFSMMLPGLIGTTTWQLTTQNDLTSSPFLAGTQTVVGATQLWPDAISGFAASLDNFGQLTVGGCLARTITTPAASPDYPRIEIDYQTKPSGAWIELGTVTTGPKMPGCADGAGFLARGPAPVASAYYRAYFPGDSAYEQATSSSSGRLWRYLTRFNPFGASPRAVLRGGKITVSGVLQTYTNKWLPYARQRILLIYSTNWSARPAKDQVWYGYAWVRTNSKGQFSKTFADPVGRATGWSANFNGNKTHFGLSAPVRVVRIRRNIVTGPVQRFMLSASGRPGQVVRRLPPWTWAYLSRRPFVLVRQPLLTLMSLPS